MSSRLSVSSNPVTPLVFQATHTLLVVGAADPGELVGSKLRALGTGQRIERGAAADGGEHGAVLRTDIVEPVGEAEASGTLHVLGDDGRVARDVLTEVTGQHARIEIVGAANAVADVELDVAAFVEFRRGLRVCRRLRE